MSSGLRDLVEPRSGRHSIVWFSLRVDGRLQHNWLSNFWIEPDGSFVEREYQAAKHEGHPWRQAIILRCTNPYRSKKLGRRWKLTEEETYAWNDRRVDVMLELIRKKVDDHGFLAQQLRFTADGPLVEENDWHDNFWGNCICGKPRCAEEGANWLGETWMEVRRGLLRVG